MDCTLVVLAAGMGNRFGGLKQLAGVGVGGETLLEYGVFDAIRAGVGKVVFVIREDFAKDFGEQVVARFQDKVEAVCVYQSLDGLPDGYSVPLGREKPWGTGHALLAAKDEVRGACVVINGDDFYGATAYRDLVSYLKPGERDDRGLRYGMVGYELKRTLSNHGSVSRGICEVDGEGYLVSLSEHTQLSWNEAYTEVVSANTGTSLAGDVPVSLNLFGLQPGFFPYLETEFLHFLDDHPSDPKAEFFLPEVVSRHVKSGGGTLRVIPTQESWFGMTYAEDRDAVTKAIRERVRDGLYPESLWG